MGMGRCCLLWRNWFADLCWLHIFYSVYCILLVSKILLVQYSASVHCTFILFIIQVIILYIILHGISNYWLSSDVVHCVINLLLIGELLVPVFYRKWIFLFSHYIWEAMFPFSWPSGERVRVQGTCESIYRERHYFIVIRLTWGSPISIELMFFL